jgi:AraC-like DNA-binding protein
LHSSLGILLGRMMALQERIHWSSPPDLPGVEVVSVQNNQRPWIVYHQTYTICNIDTFTDENGTTAPGAAEWVYRSRTHHTPARGLMLMEPGEVHRNPTTPPPCDFSVLQINPDLVNAVATETGVGSNPHFREAACGDPRAYRAFFRLHVAFAKQASLLHRQSLLVNCIGALVSAHCEKNPRPFAHPGRYRLQWAREFLEQNLAENVALDDLANISGLSRYHFLRAFTREFGLPPHAYQICLRTERVRVMLKAGVPLHSIEAGFADQSHLIRHFKRALGVTPGQYAAAVGSRRGFPEELLLKQQ